jgi:peptidoglycan glycosyltransferase
MHVQIRRVGLALLVLLLAVFFMLNYVQIYAANRIASNPENDRNLIREYSIKRGDIITVDQVTIARSVKTGGKYKYTRTYPGGDLYGQITGYYSRLYGSSRIEASYNDSLLGESGLISIQDIEDHFLGSGEQGDDVKLTIDSELQAAARESLGSQFGAVVAIDPTNGDVRALWGTPSFDPTPIASHDLDEAKQAFQQLRTDQERPLVNTTTSRGYPPGSTFKVVTTIAALESGRFTRQSTFPDEALLDIPQTDQDLTNFTKTACTGTGQIDLFTALEISCDTTFAIIGMRIHQEVKDIADKLGFNKPIDFDIATEPSAFPEVGDDNIPFRAYQGIGQGDVVATPLQMALVASAVANDGDLVKPHLVKEVIDSSGDVVSSPAVETTRVMSSETASEITDMMVAVVEGGTGTNAQIAGIEVAGKTGTAQSLQGAAPHAWFIAFAPADDPEIAVCVFVRNGGSFGAEATGGTVAAPIARQIIELDREIRGW